MARTALTYIATEHDLTREGLIADIDDAIQRLAAEYAARRDAAQAQVV